MALFQGARDDDGNAVVTKDGFPFTPEASLKVRNHSPTGFNWGYGGSGPAQLALALLLDVLGPDVAQVFYQDFKTAHVAGWQDGWACTDDGIRAWWITQAIVKPMPE